MSIVSVRVLVVGEAPTYRMIIRDAVSGIPGLVILTCTAGDLAALRSIEDFAPDVVILDLESCVQSGIALMRQMKRSKIGVGTIVLSGVEEHWAEVARIARDLCAFEFLKKPSASSLNDQVKELQQVLNPKLELIVRVQQARAALKSVEPSSPLLATKEPSPQAAQPQSPVEALVQAGAAGRVDLVVIGISTGGPPALHRLLPLLPADLGAPVLVVQHMPPGFTEPLAQGLDKRCAMNVSEAQDGQTIASGHILIAPGGRQMKVGMEGGRLTVCLSDDPPEFGCSPSVDYLLRSVADFVGARALAVIMTGMGHDGAQGCQLLKQRGAEILAQDEASCVVFGMPRDAVRSKIADFVGPPEALAAELLLRVGRAPLSCFGAGGTSLR